jgi:hypothetical protein
MLVPALATLVSYFHQTLPTHLDITDGAGVPVPPERDARLSALASQLEAEGYRPHSTVAPADPAAAGTVFARTFAHPGEATAAWAIDMTRGSLVQSYVELVTEWEDGTAITTVNHTNPSIFEPLPRLRAIVRAGAGVAEMVAAHRKACAGVGGLRLDPAKRDPLEVAQDQNREVLAYQAQCGILRRRGENYGFTLRGAWRSNVRIWRAQRA